MSTPRKARPRTELAKLRSRKTPKITAPALAEYTLLSSLALRLGQEAARQNGIQVEKYHALDRDPRGAHLARLRGKGDEPIRLRATVTLTINPTSGAVIDIDTRAT